MIKEDRQFLATLRDELPSASAEYEWLVEFLDQDHIKLRAEHRAVFITMNLAVDPKEQLELRTQLDELRLVWLQVPSVPRKKLLSDLVAAESSYRVMLNAGHFRDAVVFE